MSVADLEALAFRRYQEWPWAKVQFKYEDLAAAIGLWEPTKHEKERPTLVPCNHRGDQIGEVGCGCGARDKKLPVYSCEIFGQCTKVTSGKPQRFNGEKIAVCLGCEKREA